MRYIVDLYYKGNIVDARLFDSTSPPGRCRHFTVDITTLVDELLKPRAKTRRRSPNQKKELDSHGRVP